MRLLSSLFLLFFTTTSFAENGGSWISSGGESFYDAKNTWFLEKSDISLCIDIEDTMVSKKTVITKAVQEAYRYWQNEFKNNQGPVLGHLRKSYNLGENKLQHKKDFRCVGNEDLRILIGEKTLSQEEKSYLFREGRNYIGVTVRTDYDPKTLRGKGFIYIASDKDIDGQNRSSDLIKSPWKNDKLIKLAMIHEFGHVFGIPHMGSSIMSEVFMDLIVSKYYFRDFISAQIESFRAAPLKVERCKHITPEMVKFFEIDSRVSCLIFEKKNEKSFDVYSSYPSGKKELIANIVSLEIDVFGIESRPLGFLRLTDAQQVFTSQQTNHRTLIPGPLVERYKLNGKVIILKSLKSHPIQISLSPESVTATSVHRNKIITVFAFDSIYSTILGQTLDLTI